MLHRPELELTDSCELVGIQSGSSRRQPMVLFSLFVIIFMCLCGYMQVRAGLWGAEEVSGPLELVFLVVIDRLMGTELWSSSKAAAIAKAELSL